MFDKITLWHVIATAGVYSLWRIANAIQRFCGLVEEIIDSEPLPDASRTSDEARDRRLENDKATEGAPTKSFGIHPIRRNQAA